MLRRAKRRRYSVEVLRPQRIEQVYVHAKSPAEAATRGETEAKRVAKRLPEAREYISTEVCEEPSGPCFEPVETDEGQVLWMEKQGSQPATEEAS